MLRFLAGVSLLAGLAAAFFGVAYAVNGMTQAKAPISVSVLIRDLDHLQIQQARSTGSETDLPLRLPPGAGAFQPGLGAPGLHLYVDGLGHGSWLQAGTGPVPLHASDSTVVEWLPARGGEAVAGLCIGLGALLLRGLLLSIGAGQPFQRGNAARIAGIAGLIVIATIAAGVLRYVAARLVLGRLGLGGPGSPVAAYLTISFVPLLAALFLLAFAEAFRRGTELANDTEGLI